MRMKWTGNVARLGIMKYVDTSGKKYGVGPNMGGLVLKFVLKTRCECMVWLNVA
jgi:hypothetical protein